MRVRADRAICVGAGLTCCRFPANTGRRRSYDADTALAVIEYIHNSPVRRGLESRAEDRPWSSARDWAGWEYVVVRIDRTIPTVAQWCNH